MPWTTPSLEEVRKQNRDFVSAKLRSAALVPNSVARVLADGNAGLAYLTLLYLDWLSKQFLPDTAEMEWLDRHGNIWLGGREAATYAFGSATFTGIEGTVVPAGSKLVGLAGAEYQTVNEIVLGVGPTNANLTAITAGAIGNADPGDALNHVSAIAGVESTAIVVTMDGGANVESDDSLRARVIFRIQQPPMGGDADDYVRWAREVPGVTRAWCSPLEQGAGTVTLRFMMDDLRATSDASTSGFPNTDDIATVRAHLDRKRPVAVKDFFVVAPIPEPVGFSVSHLDIDDAATRAAIAVAAAAMLKERGAPAYAIDGVTLSAQTIYTVWVADAIMSAAGVNSFDLTMADHVMPTSGHIAVLGPIVFL